MSTVPSPERPDDREPAPSLSDEQLDAFLRESAEGGGAAAPKEPSARARMVTERLRAQDEAAASASGGRRWGREKAAPPSTPPGWRTGPAWQGTNGGRSRRRRIKSAVGVLVAVAVAVLVVKPSLVFDGIPEEPTGAAASPLPAETALPSTAPGGAALSEEPTHERPFLGSPAERWAEGADAIVLPQAKAAGGMSKAEVELALRRTKDFLVASNIDPAVLRGARPTAAFDVLDPLDSEMRSRMERALTGPTRDDDPTMFFSRFDPAEVRVLGDKVKVRGHMSFTAGDPGQVKVHADYTFVYPLVRAGQDFSPVTRTIVRRQVTMLLSDPGQWQATAGKLRLFEYSADRSNDSCEDEGGYLEPTFPDDVYTGEQGGGPTVDPYDRSRPIDQGQTECGTVSRT
ncbi:hypothetical protein AB0L67_05430 [Streptomyces flaveolus]|uniref:hypothetical protein n=1 Tax=Streptomyces flaveolus TaxID=67297 RepID=UPI00344695C7